MEEGAGSSAKGKDCEQRILSCADPSDEHADESIACESTENYSQFIKAVSESVADAMLEFEDTAKTDDYEAALVGRLNADFIIEAVKKSVKEAGAAFEKALLTGDVKSFRDFGELSESDSSIDSTSSADEEEEQLLPDFKTKSESGPGSFKE